MEKAGGQFFFLVIGSTLVLITLVTFKLFQFIWCCLWREDSLVIRVPAYYSVEACNSHLRGIVRVKASIGALFICIQNKPYLLISVLIPESYQEYWDMLDVFTIFTSIIAIHRKDSFTVPFSRSCSSVHVYMFVLIYVVQRSCSCLIIFNSYSLQKNKYNVYK